jgi:NitT/TauT family transport system substrate-binding protein
MFTLMSLTGCDRTSDDVITIGIPDGPSVISLIRLIDNPPVIDGKQVKFVIHSEPLQIQALMVQEKLDFAMLPTVMAANLYNKNVDYRLLAVPVWGTLYVVTNDSSLHDTGDLHNRTVHIFGQGTTADVLFRHYMQNKQLNNLKIDYSYFTNQEVALGLLNRTIKTAVVSEPLVSMIVAKDPQVRIISELTVESGQQHLQRNIFAQTAFVVNADLAVEHPGLVEKVLSHVEASCMAVRIRPENTARLLYHHKHTDDIGIAMRSIPLCNINYVRANEIREELHQYLHIFYTFDPKSIGGKMPDEQFVVDDE